MAKTTPLAIPELEAVEVHGMSRGAFLARGERRTRQELHAGGAVDFDVGQLGLGIVHLVSS